MDSEQDVAEGQEVQEVQDVQVAPLWAGLAAPMNASFDGHVRELEGALAAGMKIGQWELLSYVPSSNTKGRLPGPIVKGHWICRCSCGTEKSVSPYLLRMGGSRSCGHERKRTR